jgi:hypothetical protein
VSGEEDLTNFCHITLCSIVRNAANKVVVAVVVAVVVEVVKTGPVVSKQ